MPLAASGVLPDFWSFRWGGPAAAVNKFRVFHSSVCGHGHKFVTGYGTVRYGSVPYGTAWRKAGERAFESLVVKSDVCRCGWVVVFFFPAGALKRNGYGSGPRRQMAGRGREGHDNKKKTT